MAVRAAQGSAGFRDPVIEALAMDAVPIHPDPAAGDQAHVPDRVAAMLRRAIAAGRIRPGTKLPEVAITVQLGVSRHTLRSAFQTLAGEGLVRRLPHRGVFVHSPTAQDVHEIYLVRRVVEPGAVRAAQFAPEDLAILDSYVGDGRRASAEADIDGMAEANQAFHRRLVAQAHSPMLDALMEQVLARMRLVFHAMQRQPAFHVDYVEQNHRLVELLRAGRTGAADAHLTQYLLSAERQVLQYRD